MTREETIEMPFGAKDSELKGWEYTIPEGMEVIIKDGKVIVREKKKEPKPVEWGEEEETIIDCAVEVVEKAGLPSLAASLKSLRPQPKQEWNDEDELLRKRCIADLGYLTEYEPQYKERYDTQIDWLKSFRPQPKQEWSKEDKTHLAHILSFIEEVKEWAEDDGMHELCVAKCKEAISWLKSLRPSWKPSEEQMRALAAAVEESNENPVLESLCNDLIKL